MKKRGIAWDVLLKLLIGLGLLAAALAAVFILSKGNEGFFTRLIEIIKFG